MECICLMTAHYSDNCDPRFEFTFKLLNFDPIALLNAAKSSLHTVVRLPLGTMSPVKLSWNIHPVW